MPAAIIGGRLIKKCEVCGAPASHGFHVNLMAALKAKDVGNIAMAQRFLGQWYCQAHFNLKSTSSRHNHDVEKETPDDQTNLL